MKNTLLADRYPIHVLELERSETDCDSIEEVIAALRAEVERDPHAAWIADFDHHAHTRRIGGPIREDILAARNLVFCFGTKLPDPALLAVRPRSIGVVEMPGRFVISFLEAPMPDANARMVAWVTALRTRQPEPTTGAGH
jgi:hypothetical protein